MRADTQGTPVGCSEAVPELGACAQVCELPPKATDGHAEDELPSRRFVLLLCLVGALEGADSVLLSSAFYALQLDLGLKLKQLAMMGLVQGLAGNVAAPVWGTLADRGGLRRKSLIVGGCVGQGPITVALAGVSSVGPMLVLRALNGVMLASLRPIATATLADVTCEARRGEVFGRMGFMMSLGTMAGTLIGTNMATKEILGIQGWRVAFVLLGGLSAALGLLVGGCMDEPARKPRSQPPGSLVAELAKVARYFKIPTFCVVVSQGFFAVMAWIAIFGYNNLFFQVAGLTALQTSLIGILGTVSGSVGVLIGGIVGDRLSRWSPSHGRPLTAQISVAAGIPVALLLFVVHPPAHGAFLYYGALMVTLGLSASWCYFAVNAPILAEIVDAENRSSIMAWEGTMSGAFSTIFGNALVAFFAESVFGYSIERARAATPEENVKNIQALGNALAAVSVLPFFLCLLAYSFLHCTYPRDMRRLRERRRLSAGPAAAAKEESPADYNL